MRTLLLLLLAACTGQKSDSLDGQEERLEGSTQDADGDGFSDDDCNDGDASVNPGVSELCDGIDNNCDGQVDEGVVLTFYTDQDADGYGDPSVPVHGCAQPEGTVPGSTDCDDGDATVFPGGDEQCDGIDNDCDGVIDDGLLTTVYTDSDGDGHGDPATAEDSCAPTADQVTLGDDCDDTDPTAAPGLSEVCDEVDNNCDGEVDEGVTTTYFADVDGDGWGQLGVVTEACSVPDGYALASGDCDDALPAVNPDATETCNGIDDDCDGTIDEADASDALTWHADTDGDGHGDPSTTALGCSAPTGHVSDATDCDDGVATTFPGADEYCNGVDDNCDGAVDEASALDAATWYADTDGDGYGSATSTMGACVAPTGHVASGTDCDDGDSGVHPGATEICNALDDDCDGDVDDDDTAVSGQSTWYADLDSDGFGDPSNTLDSCEAPSSYGSDNQDCDDGAFAINPDADEACDGVDNDCDGDIDDDDADLVDPATWYLDDDGDGYGDASVPVLSCIAPSAHVADSTDCDDGDFGVYPGAAETCDGADENCDGTVDEGVLGTGAACPAEDCTEILDDNPSALSGTYTLDLGSYVCDMSTDGGGWTQVAAGAVVYGTGYTGTYYNTEGFRWSETLFAYASGSVQAHCTYPSSLTGCNNIGFQFASESWGVAQNWGSSLCGMATTDYTANTSYIGGADWVIDRTESTDTMRVGTLEGVAACTTADNPGSATMDILVRR